MHFNVFVANVRGWRLRQKSGTKIKGFNLEYIVRKYLQKLFVCNLLDLVCCVYFILLDMWGNKGSILQNDFRSLKKSVFFTRKA